MMNCRCLLLRAAVMVSGLLAAAFFANCGGDEAKPPSTSATPVSTVASATAGQPTVAPTQTPPSPTPTAAKAADEGPRVRWMLVDFFGPGVATVRVATDVETTATLSLATKIGRPSGVAPKEDEVFAKEHTISIPILANLPAFHVEVRDRQGRKGNGDLERPLQGGEVVGSQFFGRGEFKPKIALEAGRKATVTWTNLLGGGKPAPASVQMFARKGACTNAQACVASFVAAFPEGIVDTGASGTAAGHLIPITFPADTTQDYQVLIVGLDKAEAGAQPLAIFFQFDVPGATVK